MTERRPIVPPGHEDAYRRYGFAPAFVVDDTVHVSGIIGRGPEGRVPNDERDEYDAIFRALADVLDAAGASLADVVDLVSYHVDLHASLPAFLAAKAAALREPYPAWTAIGCTALAAPGAHVELRATAVIDRS